MNICLLCGKETKNPKFCSSSCNAKVNNSLRPKRKRKVWPCKKCGEDKGRGDTFYCLKCRESKKLESKTLAQLGYSLGYQISAVVRQLARKVYNNSGLPKECFVCKYSTHVEICHVKEIASFSKDTLVSIVNDIMNLVALCGNHHWELDHGIINISPDSLMDRIRES